MITVRLKGGMGNQMFQYAFGRALALRNNDKLALDLTFLLDRTPRPNFVFRNYDLPIFAIEEHVTLLSSIDKSIRIPLVFPLASETISGFKNKIGRQKYIREPAQFDSQMLLLEGNLYLNGYWQDERYFQSITPTIRKEFTLRKPLSGESAALRAEIVAEQNAICVNIRRGDFVSVARSMERHGFVGVEYYEKGMAALREKIKDPHAYVFSDDIDWCKENLKFPGVPTTYVGYEYAGEKFGEYLALMSACKHFLIPNSTFGWWAAWLSVNPEKIVIAPKRWYADSDDDRGVVPSTWLRI